MLPVLTGKFDDEQTYYAFKKFDTDKSGYITYDELKQILSKVNNNVNEERIKNSLATVDKNKDGKLNFKGNDLKFHVILF